MNQEPRLSAVRNHIEVMWGTTLKWCEEPRWSDVRNHDEVMWGTTLKWCEEPCWTDARNQGATGSLKYYRPPETIFQNVKDRGTPEGL